MKYVWWGRIRLQLQHQAFCAGLQLLIISTSDRQSEKMKDTVKIKIKSQHPKNKLFFLKDLTYPQLQKTIESSFALNRQQHFRLFYLDQSKDEILINNEEGYCTFLNHKIPKTLYLESTQDRNLDFRSFPQHGQTQTPAVGVVGENGKQQEASPNSQPANVQQIERKVEEKRKKLRQEIQQFKLDLQNNAPQEIQKQLPTIKLKVEQRIKEEHRNAMKLRAGNFDHSLGCASDLSSCQQRKAIKGVRYRCVVCAIDLCDGCAKQTFMSKNSEQHKDDHPMVQLRNQEWDKEIILKFKRQGGRSTQRQIQAKSKEIAPE